MSIPTGTYRIYTRTLGVAVAAAAAADEQREAGGDDVQLAHLLPRRAPHQASILSPRPKLYIPSHPGSKGWKLFARGRCVASLAPTRSIDEVVRTESDHRLLQRVLVVLEAFDAQRRSSECAAIAFS